MLLTEKDDRFRNAIDTKKTTAVGKFIVGKETLHKDIIKFYGPDFDGDKLMILHRDFFFTFQEKCHLKMLKMS